MALQTRNETRTVTQLAADVCADALAAGLAGETRGNAGGPATTPVATPVSTPATPVPLTAFGRIEPTVVVTVPALTLLGESTEPGELAGYGPIDPDTARRLAGKSKTWLRLLTDPESGVPLTLGQTRYKPTKRMRQYLELRDGTCQFRGCNRRATHCDIDHTEAWEFGGPTDCDNLSHLCPKHHRLKHQTTWQAKQLGGGSIQWTSPDGRSYVTEPEVRFLPPPGPRAQSDSTKVVRKSRRLTRWRNHRSDQYRPTLSFPLDLPHRLHRGSARCSPDRTSDMADERRMNARSHGGSKVA